MKCHSFENIPAIAMEYFICLNDKWLIKKTSEMSIKGNRQLLLKSKYINIMGDKRVNISYKFNYLWHTVYYLQTLQIYYWQCRIQISLIMLKSTESFKWLTKQTKFKVCTK
jgi:hypothetical protein